MPYEDAEGILNILDPTGQALKQARELQKNHWGVPGPPKTGNTIKDFLLNSMNALQLPTLGAKQPNPVGNIPREGLTSNLGVKQVSGGGIAENANIKNPRAMDVIKHLEGRELPPTRISDSPPGPGGEITSYITTTNPITGKPIRIRVPQDDHSALHNPAHRFTNAHGESSFYDLGTDPKVPKMHGTKHREFRDIIQKNESGEMYGKDLKTLYDAIDYTTGKDLVPPGRGPNYTKKTPEETTQPEKPLSMDDLIDSTLKNMEKPRTEDVYKMGYTDDNPFKANNFDVHKMTGESVNVNRPGTKKWQDELPMAGSDVAPMKFDPTEMMAANTGKRPNVPDILSELMGQTNKGKYDLAHMRQKVKAQGIDPEGLSYMAMHKILNPDMYPKK